MCLSSFVKISAISNSLLQITQITTNSGYSKTYVNSTVTFMFGDRIYIVNAAALKCIMDSGKVWRPAVSECVVFPFSSTSFMRHFSQDYTYPIRNACCYICNRVYSL